MFNGYPPPPFRPGGNISNDLVRWMRDIQSRLDWLNNMMLGVQNVGGTMPGLRPEDRMWCFGKLLDEGGSGGVSQEKHASAVTNFEGAGFYLPSGFLAYAFEQVYDETPEEGVVVPEGIATGFDETGQVVADAAVPLNGETWRAGDIVFLWRRPPHWSIVGARPGVRDVDIDCDDETGTATIIKEM